MAQKIATLMTWHSPGADLFYAIAAFVVVLIMGFIAAIAVMVNIEAYIIVSALVLFTGFGGSRWTKEYAMRSLTYAIAIGGKLFMLNLVVAIGQQIITTQSATFTGAKLQRKSCSFVGVILVLAAVAKQLPDMTASMLSGAAIGASSGLIGVGRTAADGRRNGWHGGRGRGCRAGVARRRAGKPAGGSRRRGRSGSRALGPLCQASPGMPRKTSGMRPCRTSAGAWRAREPTGAPWASAWPPISTTVASQQPAPAAQQPAPPAPPRQFRSNHRRITPSAKDPLRMRATPQPRFF